MRHLPTRLSAGLLPLLLLLTGCPGAGVGPAASPAAASALEDPGPRRKECRPAPAPARLPALSALTDSAAFMRAVREFTERHHLSAGTDSTYVLYTVAFGPTGAVERVKDIRWWMPDGTVDELAGIVRKHLRRQPGGPWSVRMRVRPRQEPEVVLGRSEMCLPVSHTRFSVTAPAAFPVNRPLPMLMRIRVSPSGRVLSTQVLRSSGEEELDRWVRNLVERYEHAPGTLDGVPVDMEYEHTIQIQARP